MSWMKYAAAVLVSVLLVGVAHAQPRLSVGDKAPPLAVARWLKGKPVPRLQPGTVYVIEFWASWCPPCRTSVPHLTELQKQYPDVVIIGVNSMERGQVAGPQFVREMGEQMDYRVGVDLNNRMSRTWMEAAGQDGIPCAFVVDKEGLISWIGHPMRLDTVLAQLAGGEGEGVAAEGVLRAGSPAPALDTGRWIKGEPVEAFEPGKVYVVEFWATWCPPCRQTIPHLTQLQKKYPQATIIGQNVAERSPNAAEPFVQQMGDQMNYRVALDTEKGEMAAKWLKAANQDGIPCAFVIGKDGKVAWIGHPMELEFPLSRELRKPAPKPEPAPDETPQPAPDDAPAAT